MRRRISPRDCFSQGGGRKLQFPLMGSSERHPPDLSGLEGSLITATFLYH